ncbi:hypothetical protein GCM10009836_56310 [Pseudonocardia ailaonensis]|uniref:Calcium-binding protein n=1 Tax=Pseudonocardia ailaonensis TaxID=367279 RepID=A0ABN2NHV2_9PSEU
MRRRVIAVAVAITAILTTGFLSTADTTLARYTDVEASPGQLGAATVVIGDASKSPTLIFANGTGSGTVTATLTVVYTGTTAARITLNAKPATTYASNFCTYASSTGWTTKNILGLIGPTITFSVAGTSIPYCTLLNGAENTLAASVEAGSTTTSTITATYGGVLQGLFTGKTDSVPLQLHAYATSGSGFNHTTTGTLTVSTSASATTPRSLMAARAATPASTTKPATASATPAPAASPVTAADVPAECAAAGMTVASFAEKITLTAANPSFDAARDRPGVAGPFLVIGSAAGDTITGSAGADCLVGGDGDDTISGGAGDDVLVGGAGIDHLAGEAGADRLYGGSGVDALDGGLGADLLDGQVDLATCTTDPTDTATNCVTGETTPPATPPADTPPAITPPSPTPPSAAPPNPTAEAPAPAPIAPAPTTEPPAPQAPAPAPAPEGGADPTTTAGTAGAPPGPAPEGTPDTTPT